MIFVFLESLQSMAENAVNENNSTNEPPAEIEGQFIIRFPPKIAVEIRELVAAATPKLHKRLQIELDDDRRHGKVKLDDKILPAKVYDLPCIIESHKTFDRKIFYKIADICQIMICGEEQALEENEKPYLFHEFLDKEGRDKRYLYPHGITPCLKNVRKNRFRKTRKNRCAETPFVQKEVLRLLKTDSEAINYRFELVDPEDENFKSCDNKPNSSSKKIEENAPGEFDIFGAILSSSDGSDDENRTKDPPSANSINITELEDQTSFSEDNRDNVFISDKDESKDSDSPIETEAAGISLGELLKDEKTESEKDELHQLLQELDHEIANIRAEKRFHEVELLEIKNPALRLRYEMNIEYLIVKENEKQKEYDDIFRILN